MREEDIKGLVKQSVKKPSVDFTDNLMKEVHALEVEKSSKINWGLVALYASCLTIFIMSLFVKVPEFTYMSYTVQIPSILLPILSCIFLLFELRQIVYIQIRIREKPERKFV